MRKKLSLLGCIISLAIVILGTLYCLYIGFGHSGNKKTEISTFQNGSLNQFEVETIVKKIVSESNYCSEFIYYRGRADYSIENISYVNDSYDRYLASVTIKASNGKEYESHFVNIYFRYNPTTELFTWNQRMVFFDDYPIDDFKKAINWNKETPIAADDESFDSYVATLKEEEKSEEKTTVDSEEFPNVENTPSASNIDYTGYYGQDNGSYVMVYQDNVDYYVEMFIVNLAFVSGTGSIADGKIIVNGTIDSNGKSVTLCLDYIPDSKNLYMTVLDSSWDLLPKDTKEDFIRNDSFTTGP